MQHYEFDRSYFRDEILWLIGIYMEAEKLQSENDYLRLQCKMLKDDYDQQLKVSMQIFTRNSNLTKENHELKEKLKLIPHPSTLRVLIENEQLYVSRIEELRDAIYFAIDLLKVSNCDEQFYRQLYEVVEA